MLASIRRAFAALTLVFIPVILVAAPTRAQCVDWADGQVPPAGGLWAAPQASLVFDDGSGPAYYVTPFSANGVTFGIGRWDGTSWSAVGDATDQGATCFAIYDDGTGAALYVGGA